MILPGNVGSNDIIPVSYTVTTPIATVIKKPPVIMNQDITVVQDQNYEVVKETNARNFPTLRGFA